MHLRRFERMALATFFLAACVAFLGAFVTIELAHAAGANPAPRIQGTNPAPFAPPLVNPAPSMPPPTFNPSSSYTVAPSRETPVSPASPGSVFGASPSAGAN
jgi:hypothetical protein